MFKDLETKGYVVVKNFLTQEEIDEHIHLSNNVSSTELYGADVDPKERPDKLVVRRATTNHNLTDKIQKVLNTISLETDITVNVIRRIPLFFDNTDLKITWHVDHEPYYSSYDSYNNLNFWIPLIKPSPKTSGVSVIPHDVLPKEMQDVVLRKGARRVVADGDKTIIYDDILGEVLEFNFNIEANSISPEVGVGDLLLMRSDIIHGSQEPTEHRVSISIRCYNGNARILRDKFFGGTDFKKNRIGHNIKRYQPIFDAFNRTRASYILVKDTCKDRNNWDIVPIKQQK